MSEDLQEALKALIEDRKKREEEIAAERATREREIEAERAKREEERTAREKEMKERIDAMQAHMETLMKIVEAKAKEEGPKTTELGSVKLVPLSEKDDIEAYLVTFERIMKAHTRSLRIDGRTILPRNYQGKLS